MEIQLSTHAMTLGQFAHQVIQQHFKKCTKPEKNVLQDKDPEALHQMRVGMRRLQTALQVFQTAVDLPKTVQVKRTGKIARALGAVRDADVLQTKLENYYGDNPNGRTASHRLEGAETKKLNAALQQLQKQRQHDFKQLKKTLEGDHYNGFKQTMQDWLKEPQFEPVAELPILDVLPDLLLPLISELLLHPGWLVGYHRQTSQWQDHFRPLENLEELTKLLDQQQHILHDLRKHMKRVRYETEFFVDFYGSGYSFQVKEFQRVQEVLGQIQDNAVLSQFLTNTLDAELEEKLPTIADHLKNTQLQTWQEWQPLQQRYLDSGFRTQLRSQILNPHFRDN